MKRYISIFILGLLVVAGFTACDVETNVDPGGTAVQKMAGFWDVHAVALDDASQSVIADFEPIDFLLTTYNTTDNVADKMWVNDGGKFWGMKMVVNVKYGERVFAAPALPYAKDAKATATVIDGKVLEKAGKNVHGAPADSIVFVVQFSDNKLERQGGQHTYRIEGIRHYGFSPDAE